jgi:hypothetical protein
MKKAHIGIRNHSVIQVYPNTIAGVAHAELLLAISLRENTLQGITAFYHEYLYSLFPVPCCT